MIAILETQNLDYMTGKRNISLQSCRVTAIFLSLLIIWLKQATGLRWPNICVIFLYNWRQCIDGFSLSLQRYVIKGNDAKNPAILNFCLLLKEPS